MAKAKLEYDLTDPDDRLEHLRAINSLGMAMALWEIAYNTRKKMAYAVEEMELKGKKIDPYDVVEKYRELIGEILEQHGIDPDKLVN